MDDASLWLSVSELPSFRGVIVMRHVACIGVGCVAMTSGWQLGSRGQLLEALLGPPALQC